jgi:hypothetical protein
MIEILISHTITTRRISDMMVTAFEGGSNHWISKARAPSYPDPTGYYEITDVEGDTHVVTLAVLKRGFILMAEQFPSSHWGDFLEENEDADTADVWLQLCVFQEVRYG